MLHLLVVMALSTAARAGELLSLLWRDVDLAECRAIFHATMYDEPRAAWLMVDALTVLSLLTKAKPHRKSRVCASPSGGLYEYVPPFKAAAEAATLVDFRFHDLHNTAATALAREGASEQQLKAIGSWKSNVASRYVHIATKDLKVLLRRMNKNVAAKKLTKKKV